MPKVRSHYENLKVARDAPPEVIRAAYRSLSQKYHPDRNFGDADAARVMTMINAAYAVLSDPTKKKEHDLWIAENEKHISGEATDTKSSNSSRAFSIDESKLQSTRPSYQSYAYSAMRVFSHVRRNWFLYGIGAVLVIGVINDKPKIPSPGPKPYIATSPPASVVWEYERPINAPNGLPWPTKAAYVAGYKQLNNNGLSSVTIDNAQNDADVFIKLVSLSGSQAVPVRIFFIPAHGSFTLNRVSTGSYDIRYRNLSSGGLARSETFTLDETPTNTGTKYTKFKMTLYKVRDGNMRTYDLADAEF